MSEIIGTMLKENPVPAFAGKQASAKKCVLASDSKKKKALSDVKNVVYLRNNTSQPSMKKQDTGTPKENFKTNSGKREFGVELCKTSNKNNLPVKKNLPSKSEIDEDIVSLQIPSLSLKCATPTSVDDDNYDIDDCPSCFRNDDDDVWLLDLGWPLLKNEEITNFCCDPNPITELASKECLGGSDESILENSEEEIDYGYYSPKFELSNEVRSWAKRVIIPVTNDEDFLL